jgi:hypothetical protein
VSFAAIKLYVASQRVFVSVYFVIDSVRKFLDTPSYVDNIWKSEVYNSEFIMEYELVYNDLDDFF